MTTVGEGLPVAGGERLCPVPGPVIRVGTGGISVRSTCYVRTSTKPWREIEDGRERVASTKERVVAAASSRSLSLDWKMGAFSQKRPVTIIRHNLSKNASALVVVVVVVVLSHRVERGRVEPAKNLRNLAQRRKSFTLSGEIPLPLSSVSSIFPLSLRIPPLRSANHEKIASGDHHGRIFGRFNFRLEFPNTASYWGCDGKRSLAYMRHFAGHLISGYCEKCSEVHGSYKNSFSLCVRVRSCLSRRQSIPLLSFLLRHHLQSSLLNAPYIAAVSNQREREASQKM